MCMNCEGSLGTADSSLRAIDRVVGGGEIGHG